MNNSLKTFLIIGGSIACLALVFGGMWWVFQSTNTPSNLRMTPVRQSDWKFGNPNAKVTLLEYSDLECPVCKEYEPIVEQARAAYASSTLFVYRHFPLQQHQWAMQAAEAAESAGMQGKFWDMVHVLFQNQDIWVAAKDPKPLFLQYAQQLGLDIKKFQADESSQAVADKVTSDRDTALQDQIPGTPTFFLNGQQVQFQSYDQLKQLLDQALAS